MAAFPDGVTALTGAFDINHFGATCLSGRDTSLTRRFVKAAKFAA
jgi:hypothetical protein